MRTLMRRILKTPIRYYGGKQFMVNEILQRIPEHQIYVEPFFGGGAIFFAKPPSNLEVINDINSEVINFYVCLKQHFKELSEMIQSTLHSRQLYEDALVMYNNPHLFHRLQRAWAFWILTNQGRMGEIKSWGYSKQNGRDAVVLENKKEAFDQGLQRRIASAQIECQDVLKIISSRDSKDTFFYLDPPYINTHLGHYKGYTEVNFKDLLDQLKKIKGKFLLSCFPNKLLTTYRKKHRWKHKLFEKYSPAKKDRKTEILVANYPI